MGAVKPHTCPRTWPQSWPHTWPTTAHETAHDANDCLYVLLDTHAWYIWIWIWIQDMPWSHTETVLWVRGACLGVTATNSSVDNDLMQVAGKLEGLTFNVNRADSREPDPVCIVTLRVLAMLSCM